MEKHLLPHVQKYFKTCLHTHSTISDGRLTPAEVKEYYKAHGYSILSLTDHNIVADHSCMNEDDFLMLTGAEYNINGFTPLESHAKTYHLNCIAKKPDILWQPFAAEKYKDEVLPYLEKAEVENMPRVYDIDAINAIIARANEKGHLVMYNHPIWSLQDYTDYAPLKGLWGMELCNYSSIICGFPDEQNAMVYRDLMNLHGNIFPLGADDAHSTRDACGAWIMVGAEKLEYDSVITALEKGDFYASTGPEIHSLTWDGANLEITCSDAASIWIECGNRYAKSARMQLGQQPLREAIFDMTPWLDRCVGHNLDWMRVIINGTDGSYASTRAYTYAELK